MEDQGAVDAESLVVGGFRSVSWNESTHMAGRGEGDGGVARVAVGVVGCYYSFRGLDRVYEKV